MKKFLLILAGASSLAISSSYALAEGKILSPVSDWNVEKLKAVGSKSACLVYSQYEDGIALSLEALQSQLSAMRLSISSGTFETGQSYDVTVDITPNYRAFKSAHVVSENELVIDAAKDAALLSALQHGFIITLTAKGWSYGLSLNGASEGVRRLLTCRDTNWRAAKRVYDSVNSQASGPSVQETSPETSGLPIQLSAYPLDRPEEENAPAEAGVPADDNVVSLPVAESGDALNGSKETDYIVETETTETVEQGGDVIDLSGGKEPRVVIEPVNTVTRVHKPKVKILPRHKNIAPGAEAVVDVAVPARASDDLVKPPEFDESLLSEGRSMSNVDAGNPEMPVPERNPDASLSSPHENVKRLARKNDIEQEILLEDSAVPRRNEDAVLSQAPNRVYTRPVVIPRIPEADFPSRIDITNRDIKDAQDIEAKADSHNRSVSNQELEQELKSQEVSDAMDTLEHEEPAAIITPPPASAPDILMPTEKDAPPRWNAREGDDLRKTLAKWSVEEGVELIWDSEQQYALLSPVKMNASFEKAVAHVLNRFMVAPDLSSRPVGQLYVDPQSGKKVLVVQSDQG